MLATLAGVPAILCIATLASAQTFPPQATSLVLGEDDHAANYEVASVLVNSSNLFTSFLNVKSGGTDGSPKWAPYAGIIGGLAGIGLGGAGLLDDAQHDQALGITNIVVGTLSLVAGGAALLRANHAEEAPTEAYAHPNAVHFAAGIHKGRVPGVGLSLKF